MGKLNFTNRTLYFCLRIHSILNLTENQILDWHQINNKNEITSIDDCYCRSLVGDKNYLFSITEEVFFHLISLELMWAGWRQQLLLMEELSWNLLMLCHVSEKNIDWLINLYFFNDYNLDHNPINEMNVSIGALNIWPHNFGNYTIIVNKCRQL